MAENPTSSSTMYTTLGATWGATGWRYGAQSGTESRTSTLITPWNALPMASTSLVVDLARGPYDRSRRPRASPRWGECVCYAPSRPISWSRWTAWLREEVPSLR